ncbi:LysR family transcriptional regulator [Tomitella cavernea]|uniref:LysR substrate-binding domain-containing protein n=1 Tax=Tomitella cavernea TaxID=1387982 RepID=A0ABP9C268_9ACTN|nr:LysR family transcriptional regulator [Tomitella cavernea]
MDLQSLTYFVAVVDRGGVTRAAESLYISQPSLSQSIRTLERRLGVTLFDRGGGRLELTTDGRAFDTAARRILADVEHAKEQVGAVRALRAGRVDLVTYPAFSVDPLVDLLRRFRQRYPEVVVRVLDAAGPDEADATMRRGAAEVALQDVPRGGAQRTLHLCEQELVLALPAVLAATLPDPVPRPLLAEIPLVIDLTDTVLAELVTAGGGRDGGPVLDCTHANATRELVLAGAGATIVPRPVARAVFPQLDHRPLSPPSMRAVGLTLRAGKPSPAAAAFAAVAREWSGRQPTGPGRQPTDPGGR